MHEIALRPVLPAFISDAAERITRHLRDSGAQEAGPLRVIYHGMVTEDSDGPVEVAVPFGPEAWTALTRRQAVFPRSSAPTTRWAGGSTGRDCRGRAARPRST